MLGTNNKVNIQYNSDFHIFDNLQEEVIVYEIIRDMQDITVDLRVKYMNNMAIINKIVSKEVIGKSITELYDADIAALHLKMVNKILKSGEGKKYEAYFEPLNKYYSVSAYSPDDNAYITISTDITEHKKVKEELRQTRDNLERKVNERTAALKESNKALKNEIKERRMVEETLRKSEQKFRSVVEQSYNGIMLCDEQGIIIEWNKAEEKITGIKRDKVIGKVLWDILFQLIVEEHKTPEVYEHLKTAILKVFKTGKTPSDIHAQEIRRPDGKLRFVEQVISAIQTDKGFMVCAIIQDITERKKMEDTLRESEEKFRETLQQSYDGIVITDEQGTIIEWNPALEQIIGLKKENVMGNYFWDIHYQFTPEEKRTPEQVEKIKSILLPLLEGKNTISETHIEDREIQLPDGKCRFIQSINFPIKTEKGIMLGSFNRDISDRKKVEKQLKETVEELKRSNEELQRFAYVASHDLQEPLRTVASFTQLLERRYKGKLDNDADEFMEYIVEAALRMKELIGALLDYSRITTKVVEFKSVDTGSILDQTIDNLQYAIEESNAKVTYDPMPVVIGDEIQLQRVFQNLLSNAIKFKKEEPLKVHISAIKNENNNEYIFEVADNGIGIDKQYADRIFVIFQRLHTREEYSGTGIGLSTVKRIIERHGGRIWVESELGIGSTFYFALSKS